jgi:ectoine hydroxylase-related dioxygenase (phytanoyl-CoA dioxygenase family)
MLTRVIDIVRRHAAGEETGNALVLPEANLAARHAEPEQLVSKVFRLHRDPVFASFAASGAVTDIVADLIGPALDCFLSQFIFKNPSAWGQPWHQDSFYFPFEPPRPIVGVWLAVTAATLDNGCLHVLAGSNREPIHEHVPDRRPGANYGYVEITDHDMTGAQPVLMEAGDLLVFDSHLMHRSTDNLSAGIRAAMVYHYAASGTVEKVPGLVNDFVPVRT